MRKKYLVLLFILCFGIFISCEQDITVSPAESEPSKAFIFITSYPSGAMIYKNGKYSGRRTPDTLKFVDFGEYTIKLRMENFRDTIFNISVKEEKLDRLDIDYSKNPLMLGKIFCVSNPNKAKIYLNDSLTNKLAADTLKGLLPGTYRIKYSYPEHRDGEVSVVVRSNQVARASKTLQDTTVWVDYNDSNSDIRYDYINCIKIDYNNVKWLGTEGFGLIKFDEKNFVNYRPPTFPIPSGLVTAIDIDENNIKWVATYG
ncbi:MAG TPA: PEGA domain-containing protein, partial [Melioribacteraceae bacterium]|nr:PEGA domain-containing protein [Melioribacteraceae bacterium]